MDENIIEQIEDIIINKLEDDKFILQEKDDKGKNALQYFLSRNIDYGDLPDDIMNKVYEKFYFDYEQQQFDMWWRMYGDDFIKEKKKYNPTYTKNQAIQDAYEQWSQQNGDICYTSWVDGMPAQQYFQITIIYDNNKYSIDIEHFYEVENATYNKQDNFVEIYEEQLDNLKNIISVKLPLLNVQPLKDNTPSLPGFEAKVNKISKKIVTASVSELAKLMFNMANDTQHPSNMRYQLPTGKWLTFEYSEEDEQAIYLPAITSNYDMFNEPIGFWFGGAYDVGNLYQNDTIQDCNILAQQILDFDKSYRFNANDKPEIIEYFLKDNEDYQDLSFDEEDYIQQNFGKFIDKVNENLSNNYKLSLSTVIESSFGKAIQDMKEEFQEKVELQ